MSRFARRALVTMTTVSTAAGLVVGGSGAGAIAASSSFQHLTTTTVLTALPSTASLPKGVKLLGKVEVAPAKPATPCGTAKPTVALPNASAVAAIYTDGKTSAPSATTSVWTVSAAVFVTDKQALSSAVALAKAETTCPKTVTEDGVVLTRTVAALDTAEKGLWQGFRVVSHLTAPTSKSGIRVWTTWFTRGNVLLQVTEAAPITATSQKTQDALRKSVIVTTLAKLDKAAA